MGSSSSIALWCREARESPSPPFDCTTYCRRLGFESSACSFITLWSGGGRDDGNCLFSRVSVPAGKGGTPSIRCALDDCPASVRATMEGIVIIFIPH